MNNNISNCNSTIIFLSHGGGPLPILEDNTHKKMIEFTKNISSKIERPNAIIVFSAHWEEEDVTIQSGSEPGILYDYYGFPESAYNITYPCKGNNILAEKVAKLLSESHINCRLDNNRPYDHGTYIPLKLMYPNADIPVIQISLNKNLDPLTHLNIGKALRPLLSENLLIIGSGFTFHNMRAFDFSGSNIEDTMNNTFQNRLIEICCTENEEERWEDLIKWEEIPGARYCHPREEHLLPLHICAGMAGNNGAVVFDDYIVGKRATGFLWKC